MTDQHTSLSRTALAPVRWHRPLLWVAAVMAVLSSVFVVLSIMDSTQIAGANRWFKPLKFTLSTAIYSLSFSWLIGRLRWGRTMGHVAGTVAAVGVVVEIVIIVGAAALGTTSHFTMTTPAQAAAYSTMGVTIVVVWVMSLLIGLAAIRPADPDPARRWALRCALALGLTGIALAFLMVTPTAQQLAHFNGMVGAHTVGAEDGGPGLPFLGWSTQHGDLRVSHFVGMHALQVIPLILIALELLAPRLTVLTPTVRLCLILVASTAYAGALILLTWQALIGQSVVRPRGAVLVTGCALAAAVALVVGWTLLSASRRTPAEV